MPSERLPLWSTTGTPESEGAGTQTYSLIHVHVSAHVTLSRWLVLSIAPPLLSCLLVT